MIRPKSLTTEELLVQVEASRRTERYGDMGAFANRLESMLGSDTSQAADVLRSKVTYELHMALFQQAQAKQAEARELLHDSLRLARQSAADALAAGDPVGALFAKANIGGHLMPALGDWQGGLATLPEVYEEAEALAVAATDDAARTRALRVAVNAYLLAINLLVEHDDNPHELEEVLSRLEVNQFYLDHKDDEWVAGPVAAARAFIERHT